MLLAGLGAKAAPAPPVSVIETADTFTLANGLVNARIDKRGGAFSLEYEKTTVIERGYWSQVGRSANGDIARFGGKRSASVRIDPAKNSGERGEVVCRFEYDGKSGALPCDVELRFALGRGDTALYTSGYWEHKTGYPEFSVGEARTAYKLNPRVFDFLTIDANRNEQLPNGADWDKGEQLNMKEVRRIKTGPFAGRVEHKYDYSAILADTPAYGWSSTRQHVGVWLINPSSEYLAGGPTKVELTGHLDVNPGGAPTLLNMWHGSHYGGSSLVVAESEAWSKMIGPFLLYCNAAPDHDALWKNALARAQTEKNMWPYAWEADAYYPAAEGRGEVSGKLTVEDAQAAKTSIRNLRVGLAAEPYTPSVSRGRRGGPIDWQRDSKHYQFWTKADEAGNFSLKNVRPGTYALYAFADGVLGEFTKTNITVTPGKSFDVGSLVWKPVHYGRRLWEIGIPNRSAEEFRHGDHYWQWGLYYDYAKEFPHDVNFIVGQSDWHQDWNFVQPPRIDGKNITPSTWSITFNLPAAGRGKATLRLAIAGSRVSRGIDVSINDQPAGNSGPLPDTGVMHRDGIRGYWCEREVTFDAALLKAGKNILQLHVPAASWVNGVLYDYVSLELDANGMK